MTCKLCAWLRNQLCGDADPKGSFWKQSDDWERAQSNEFELWSEASEDDRERIDTAIAIQDTDPAAAFRIFLDLAEAGMVWAMEKVAWHYELGVVVAADFGQAQSYYRRAIQAGSWTAAIAYAKLLAREGHVDACETWLQDCAKADFVPAYFWLAWYRLKRSGSRATCREVRPLLEHAADAGHPAAAMVLARLKLRGKFGFREIPGSFNQLVKIVERSRREASSIEPDRIPEGATIH